MSEVHVIRSAFGIAGDESTLKLNQNLKTPGDPRITFEICYLAHKSDEISKRMPELLSNSLPTSYYYSCTM